MVKLINSNYFCRERAMHHLCRLIRIPCASAAALRSSSSSSLPAARVLGVGDVLRETRRFSESDVARYAEASGDRNPLHFDPDFARSAAGFDRGAVVHGILVASLFPALIASHFPGAVYVSQTLQFKLPVYIGDEVIAEVQAINLRENKKRHIVKFTTKCFTSMEHLVINGEATAILPTLAVNR